MKRSIVLSLSLLAIATAAPAGAQMHAPVPMTQSQFENAVTGSPVQLAVRVDRIGRDWLYADLLASAGEARYKNTGKQVALYFPADTPILMGSSADVKAGAVLFVYGIATTHDRADVKRVVVVTQYATIEK